MQLLDSYPCADGRNESANPPTSNLLPVFLYPPADARSQSACLLPPACFFSLKEIKGLRTLIEDYYLIMEQHVLSYILQFFQAKYMLVCQTYVTPYLMKSRSVSFGDFHPSGRIGKQL